MAANGHMYFLSNWALRILKSPSISKAAYRPHVCVGQGQGLLFVAPISSQVSKYKPIVAYKLARGLVPGIQFVYVDGAQRALLLQNALVVPDCAIQATYVNAKCNPITLCDYELSLARNSLLSAMRQQHSGRGTYLFSDLTQMFNSWCALGYRRPPQAQSAPQVQNAPQAQSAPQVQNAPQAQSAPQVQQAQSAPQQQHAPVPPMLQPAPQAQPPVQTQAQQPAPAQAQTQEQEQAQAQEQEQAQMQDSASGDER